MALFRAKLDMGKGTLMVVIGLVIFAVLMLVAVFWESINGKRESKNIAEKAKLVEKIETVHMAQTSHNSKTALPAPAPTQNISEEEAFQQKIAFLEETDFASKPFDVVDQYAVSVIVQGWLAQHQEKDWTLFQGVRYIDLVKTTHETAHKWLAYHVAQNVIVDTRGFPIAIVNHMHQTRTDEAARIWLTVREKALKQAGIEYVEIFPTDEVEDIFQKLSLALVHHFRALA